MGSPYNFLSWRCKRNLFMSVKPQNEYMFHTIHKLYSTSTCPHLESNASVSIETNSTKTSTTVWKEAKPYSKVPGPKPMPILGNTWR